MVLSDSNDNRLFIEIFIGDSAFEALLDSGAQMSLLSFGFVSSLGVTLRKDIQSFRSIFSANGTPINILGAVALKVLFNGVSFLHEFVVADFISSPIILGIDFWNRFGLTAVFSRAFTKNVDGKMLMPKSSIPSQVNSVESRYVHPRCSLTPQQESRLQAAIKDFEEISSDNIGLGKTTWLSHKINTVGPPIRQRYYPLSPAKLKILNEEIDKMLEAGVIRPSRSPWASPVVMVTKKDGSVRFCVDSRKLNSVTVRDAYPLPRIQDILDNLRGAKFITSLDFRSAFWQIPLADKESCEKTAFIVPQRGLFEFVRMPFGLTNAASEMQRLTDLIVNFEFTKDSENYVFGYVDDLILVSRDFDSHLVLLKKVKERLKEAGLSVNIKKCDFCKSELKYLGYILNEKGLQTDPSKLEAIKDFPVPATAKALRGFIGLCSYYRRFVDNFSSIIAPLTSLIGSKKGKDPIEWSKEADLAFKKLKDALIDTPVMSCPDFSVPFILQCDASSVGLGSVLSQNIDGVEHPIAYFSKLFSKAERNYSTTERELLSVLESVKHFRGYLDGARFTIVTDHIALKWLLTLNNPTGRLARWATIISQFDFTILHRKGSQHVVPDALSRAHALPIIFDTGLNTTSDVWFKRIYKGARDTPQIFPSYAIQDGQLMRRMPLNDPLSCNAWRIVLPREKVDEAIWEAHKEQSSIHPGIMKTYLLLKSKYYWPNMFRDVTRVLSDCEVCKSYKIATSHPRGQMLYPKPVSAPMQMLSLDLIGPLPVAYYGYRYILSVVDVFSKYIWLFSLKKVDAKSICDILETQIFLSFGVPHTLLCDNATVFKSVFFASFLRRHRCCPFFTPYYSPQSNTVERYNQSVITCLSILVGKNHRSWARLLPKVKLYLNSCINLATSYSPNFLMFGRDVVIDSSCGHDQTQCGDLAESRVTHAANLLSLDEVYAKVADNLSFSFLRNSGLYNKNRVPVTLRVGDIVWRRNFSRMTDFSNKFAPRFIKARVVKVVSRQVYELRDVDSPHIGQYHIKDILK